MFRLFQKPFAGLAGRIYINFLSIKGNTGSMFYYGILYNWFKHVTTNEFTIFTSVPEKCTVMELNSRPPTAKFEIIKQNYNFLNGVLKVWTAEIKHCLDFHWVEKFQLLGW